MTGNVSLRSSVYSKHNVWLIISFDSDRSCSGHSNTSDDWISVFVLLRLVRCRRHMTIILVLRFGSDESTEMHAFYAGEKEMLRAVVDEFGSRTALPRRSTRHH